MNKENWIWLIGAILILAVGFLITHPKSIVSSQSVDPLTQQLTAIQAAHGTIKIYSPINQPASIMAEALLDMYGINGDLIPINSPADLKSFLPTLTDDDIISHRVTAPLFVLPNGQLVNSGDIYHALTNLHVEDLHPGKTPPFIILYGIPNCPYTARARQELDDAHIKYEYIDLNSDPVRYMGELGARLTASGYTGNAYNTPLLEINGYIRPRDFVENMIVKLKAGH